MKRLRQYICEAKFKGLNADELKVLDDELKEILKNESHFSKLNKKNKIIVRVFAAIMAGLMLLGTCASLLYMIFIK